MSEAESTSETLSAGLADFVADLTDEALPEAVVETVERAFLDTLGVTIAGRETAAGRASADLAAVTGAGGVARLVGGDERVSVAEAALANGTAAHALDYDDVNEVMSAHPSAVLVPAILAVADSTACSGREAITAYVAGFETAAHLGSLVNPAHYEAGWHATATLGTFGAAAASAHLLDLDVAETRHALNTAASTAAGLKRNFGTQTKPLHAGQAARSGVTAALLAARGHTAAADAVGGPGGFTDLYADVPVVAPDRPDTLFLASAGISVKKFPCCYFTHAPAQAAIDIASATAFDPAAVERVEVTLSRGAADALQYDDPETADEAKFSLPYTVAHALTHQTLGLTAFTDSRREDTTVQRLRERVRYEVEESLPYESFETTVAVTFDDRQRLSRRQTAPPGTPATPLSLAELREKYEACVASVEMAVPEELATAALSLRDLDDVSAELPLPRARKAI